MSAVVAPTSGKTRRPERPKPLENGDRLTAPEFLRRYEAMPHLKKVELIEGTVYVPSPVRYASHSVPDALLQTWLGTYAWETPGTQVGGNGTVKLDLDNVPQPDVALRILEDYGGSSRLDENGYLVGPPELVAEVAASSSSIDLHDKLQAYRRNGIQEYLVWRPTEKAFDWFTLKDGRYRNQSPDPKGLSHSSTFPSLVLNVPALLNLDGTAVLATLTASLKSKAHQTFVAELARRKAAARSKS